VQPSAAAEPDPLDLLEQSLLRDYQRFEEKLLELAEYTRKTDPDRAELLVRTRSESTTRRVAVQMQRIAEALQPTASGDVLYGDALSRQDELIADLVELLKLLQSEDERDRLAREIARLETLLKETQRLIAHQKDVRADTERGGELSESRQGQQKVNDEASELAEKIDRQDAERRAEAERERRSGQTPDDTPAEGAEPQNDANKPGEPSDEQTPAKEPADEKQADSRKPEDQPSGQSPSDSQSPAGEGPFRPSEPSPSESSPSQPSPSEPSPSQPSPGQSPPSQKPPGAEPPPAGDPPPPTEQTPGREQLEQARERMEQAIRQLEEEHRRQASDEQDAAVARLEEMKAQLEEILRQLREEERKLLLAQLEARFQRMLERQLDINNGTLKLDRITPADRDESRHFAEATRLSRDESENVNDADKALALLKEEGSSVAFPESVEQMRDNMLAVVGRLQRGDTADTTQLLERLIVESLEEMILALQREMEKQDQQQGEPQPQQPGEPQDPALVDLIAELKMIRTLQLQINRLTQQYGAPLAEDQEQVGTAEDLEFLRKLSVRQERVQRATYDLSVGKNR
jgi:hypothetical protein